MSEGILKKHQIGIIGLTAIGVGTMIGSGWLFSSYYATKIAGPSAYISWIITCVIILLLGLCLAEIATIYPKRGLMARLLAISHNKDFGIICALATWLGLTAVIATEAEGTIQYLSSVSPALGQHVFSLATRQLTTYGLLIAIGIIICYGLVNFWGIKILSHSNVVLTVWKVVIPIITAVTIMFAAFHSGNFSVHVIDTQTSTTVSSVFIAMIAAGMIYSFNGFQNIVSFAAEVKNPQKNIPMAMIGAVGITLIVYLILQTAFIGSISPEALTRGWSGLNFTSPFVQITALLNLNLIMILLYADSVISPAGTGLIYTGSTTRLLTGMSQDGQMPKYFDKYCRFNFSRRSLCFVIILAIVFLLLFRSWSALVSFLSIFYVISYMSIPLSLARLHKRGEYGVFKIPAPKVIVPIIFVILSFLFCFSKCPYTIYVSVFMIIAYLLFLLSGHYYHKTFIQIFKNSYLIMIYLIALSVISFLGPLTYGGIGFLNNYLFFVVLAIVSLIVYWFSVNWKLSGEGACSVDK